MFIILVLLSNKYISLKNKNGFSFYIHAIIFTTELTIWHEFKIVITTYYENADQ